MRAQPHHNPALASAARAHGIGADLTPREIEAALISLDREQIKRKGFKKFVELAWAHVPFNARTPYVFEPHIGAMCDHAEACVVGSRYNPDLTAPPMFQELAVNVPPGYTKSMIFSVLYLAWIWTFRPEFRMLTASFDHEASMLNASHCRDLVTSKWYVERWGNMLDPVKSRKVSLYFTRAGGFRFSTSIGGKGTGRHGHMFVVDDPVKPPPEDSALAGDVTREIVKANSWLRSVAASRTTDAKTYVQIVVMQRLSENDPTAALLKDNPKACHLYLPSRFDPNNVCRTPIGGDWRTEKGEPLAPLRFPALVEDKRAMKMGGWEGPIASAQLQQQPAPAGGLIFKVGTFQKFKASVLPHTGRGIFLVLSVDCNFKKSPINSDVGFTIEGIDGQARIFTYWAGSETLGYVETRARILELVKLWRPGAILIEDKANGSAIIDELKTTYRLGNVIGPNPDTTKESRAHAANVAYQAGMVYHNEEMLCGGNLSTCSDFEGALAKFPRGMKKDVIDAHSMAVLYLMSTNEAEKMAAMQKMGDLAGAFARHFRLG